MALGKLKIATWIALMGLGLSVIAFGFSLVNFINANRQYVESNTLNLLDKRLNGEVISATRVVADCLRNQPCDPSQTSDMQQAFFVFFGYLDSVAHCVQLELCSAEIATSLLSAEIDAARRVQPWILETRQRFQDPDYLIAIETAFLDN